MNYVLLCPRVSVKDSRDLIKKLNGLWNGIGYAFPEESRPLVEAWFRTRALYIVSVPWEGTFEEYREFCREDWDYVRISELKIKIHCLEREEESNG